MKLTRKQLNEVVEEYLDDYFCNHFKDISELSISEEGKNFILKEECSVSGSAVWKKCMSGSIYYVNGIPHIGVGHRIYDTSKFNKTLSENEIYSLFDSDLEEAQTKDNWKSKIKVKITQSMYDSLVSIVFNSGPGIDSIINLINDLKFYEASRKIKSFKTTATDNRGVRKTLKALIDRRKKESALFAAEGLSCSGVRKGAEALGTGAQNLGKKVYDVGEYIYDSGLGVYDYFFGEDEQEKEKGTK